MITSSRARLMVKFTFSLPVSQMVISLCVLVTYSRTITIYIITINDVISLFIINNCMKCICALRGYCAVRWPGATPVAYSHVHSHFVC